MVEKFRENVENHANTNFRDKIALIALCEPKPVVDCGPF